VSVRPPQPPAPDEGAGVEAVYDAPDTPVRGAGGGGRLLGFVVQRLLRVGSAALVLVVLGEFVRPGGGLLQGVVLGLSGVALWTPTSLVLFRARFLTPPGLDEDHPEVRTTLVRALTAEHLIGSLPLIVAAVFAIRFLGVLGIALGVIALGIVGRKLLAALVAMERHVAGLEREQQLWSASVARLARLEGRTLGAQRDAVRSDLAQSLQLMGRVDEAIEVLSRIADPARHRVPVKLARLVVARDAEHARALLEGGGASRFDRLVIDVLATLHGERGKATNEQLEALRQAMIIAPPRQQGLLALLLGACQAARAPDDARATLAVAEWSADDLPWLRSLWPAVADRLDPLWASTS